MVHNHIKRQVCADGAPEPRTCGVAVSRVSGSMWDARRISRSGIFWRMNPGFFALPRGRMMSPTSPRGQTSTCSPPKVHTSTHYHHLVGVKRPQRQSVRQTTERTKMRSACTSPRFGKAGALFWRIGTPLAYWATPARFSGAWGSGSRCRPALDL